MRTEAKSRMRQGVEHWHKIALLLIAYDFVAVNGAYFMALWLRFDCMYSKIPAQLIDAWIKFVPIYTVFCIGIFIAAKLYQSLWRFASYHELLRIILASFVCGVFHAIGITVLFKRMPISYYIIGMGIQFCLLVLVRFSYRFILLERSKLRKSELTNVMLIGAGAAGQMILRDIQGSQDINERVCCIIDDNSNKWGRYIDGVPIVGGRDHILLNVDKYHIKKIYLAIPSATVAQRRDILYICNETDCQLKNLPGVSQIVKGTVKVSAMQDVKIEDLLGRDPIKVRMNEIFDFIAGKVILVTGGGGSIGSELCRQIAQHNPKQLIILDIYENNAHQIQLELSDNYPELNLVVLIGSVRDSRRVNQIFEKYKPEVVYHAAAHKHVPLMEDSPCESIKNNAIGTYKTAYAAMMNGCKRFVLISTDKAVNPTNIMGASKRLCEMIVQCFDKKIKAGKADEMPAMYLHADDDFEIPRAHSGKAVQKPCTEYVAVRFGNVLGSNGSVLPRFKEQIAKGGPVTVTHPDIIRYFMTVPEAVSLVLQAGVYAKGGEIFVLDMGEPVKIDTLARNLIRLSGLKPDVDIKVVYTGLRKGEKLYEEKLMAEEGIRKTPNHLIHIGNPIAFDEDRLLHKLDGLMEAAYAGDEIGIRRLVADAVPTYRPANIIEEQSSSEHEQDTEKCFATV